MKKTAALTLMIMACLVTKATDIVYTLKDSILVTSLLQKAEKLPSTANPIIFFAQQLTDIPYKAKTLEGNKKERLVINLQELDCTTYVETVTALTLCTANKRYTFQDFCQFLQNIRYKQGHIHYSDRLHYFTSWIISNTEKGYVREINLQKLPFIAKQKLNINFMTTHTQLYPMLVARPEWIKSIEDTEKQLTGKIFPYIPKEKIANNNLFRTTIKDGDIIAITTSKKGLDTSHIGIAIWHKDGIHLLNASQIHGKTVEEPMKLITYMLKHPSQTGIRVIRISTTINGK